MGKILLCCLLLLSASARAGVWSDCVLYNRADPKGDAMYRVAAADLDNTVIADLSVLDLPAPMLKQVRGKQNFVAVCSYVKAYTLPAERHCVYYNRDYRFDHAFRRWVYDPGRNLRGIGLVQCWFASGWRERTGYWGESGTPEAGKWIKYKDPCAGYRERKRRGGTGPPDRSCDAGQGLN